MSLCNICKTNPTEQLYSFKYLLNGEQRQELVNACKRCIIDCGNCDLGFQPADNIKANIESLLKRLIIKYT